MLIDISQEVFSSAVYPGDPVPNGRRLSCIADGALYNLTELSMCVHNGTHVDAPFHFIESGKTIPLSHVCRQMASLDLELQRQCASSSKSSLCHRLVP